VTRCYHPKLLVYSWCQLCHQPSCRLRLLCRPQVSSISHVSPLALRRIVPGVHNSQAFFAEHKHHKVQSFRYDAAIHQPKTFTTAKAFFEFLKIPDEPPPRNKRFNLRNFIQTTNAMAVSMRFQRECLSLCLAFLPTGYLNSRFSKQTPLGVPVHRKQIPPRARH